MPNHPPIIATNLLFFLSSRCCLVLVPMQHALPAPALVLVAVGVGGRRQLRVEAVVQVLLLLPLPGVGALAVVVVRERGSPEDGERERLRVHPGVDEAHARRPRRRPPPAVRHRRAHRRRPHGSCTSTTATACLICESKLDLTAAARPDLNVLWLYHILRTRR
uniref:Uncharacterized protein n=1 Tax=Zea mays TaxID=4577 RepID=A0A804PQH0_MAIZE